MFLVSFLFLFLYTFTTFAPTITCVCFKLNHVYIISLVIIYISRRQVKVCTLETWPISCTSWSLQWWWWFVQTITTKRNYWEENYYMWTTFRFFSHNHNHTNYFKRRYPNKYLSIEYIVKSHVMVMTTTTNDCSKIENCFLFHICIYHHTS